MQWVRRSASFAESARFICSIGLLAVLFAFTPIRAQAEIAAVPQRLAAALEAVQPDPLPAQLAADAHFVVSDEGAHWLFREAVSGLGGALIGVGTDPNYLLAGWARPEVLILLDFDQVVVDVHAVYRVVFLNSPDPESFLRAWAADRKDDVERWIAAAHPDPTRRQQVLRAYRMARNLIAWRLQGLRKAYRAQKVATFLDDAAQYAHLRDLFQAGRVFAIRGDLTGRSAVRGVAAALKDAGIPVRVLYLSNAEKYFDCTQDYRANMRALSMDDRTVVLRTAGGWDPEVAPDGLYTYLVQPGPVFQAWMQEGVPCSFKAIVSRRKLDKNRNGLGTLTASPPAPRPKTRR